ncbi:MAG: CRISPR-associated protein Csx19 [Dethiobacteria bacterium]
MNGLKLKKDRTRVKQIQKELNSWLDLENTLAKFFAGDGYIVAYLHYKVMVGKINGGKPKFFNNETFNPKYLLKLRAFNKNQELLIWPFNGHQFQGRLRIDGENSINDDEEIKCFIEAEQVLWGTNYEILDDGWARLFEKRGTELIIPPDIKVQIKNSAKNRLKIKTRNYIGFNKMGQAGYEDCRFVEFTGGEE